MAPEKLNTDAFSPFPGLRPFAPEEKDFFFGRENESEVIAAKLLKNRFVAVTGASGSGKSSLITCGLLPIIKSFSAGGEGSWRILIMRPGIDPFGNLADLFVENLFGSDYDRKLRNDILKILRDEPEGITVVIRKLFSRINGKILLFVDQFEEIFRYRPDGRDKETGSLAEGFINLLTNAITHINPDFYLVIALRSDLITECAHYRSFTNLINSSHYLVSKMNRESIREAITGPVKRVGAEIDTDLVELLIGEIKDRSDQLPILQHALMRTWMRWKELADPDRAIDFSDYFAIGTIRDAISRHADEIYETLGNGGKSICEKLFRLITGKGADNKGIRYPTRMGIISSAIGCSEDDLVRVIEEFRDPSISVLTPHYTVKLSENSIIDLSHESLIHLWGRLRKWVDEESLSVGMYLRLSEASELYQLGRTGLLKPPELHLALEWRDKNKPTLWWAQKYNPAFERAMVYLRTSEKEFNELEERKIRHNKWRLKRIRIISSILGGIAMLAGLITVIAFISKVSADNRRRLAEKEKLEIAAQKSAADQYATAALRRSVISDSAALAASRREQMEKIMRLNAENQVVAGKQEIDVARKQSETAMQISMLANMNADSALKLRAETQRLRMVSLAKSMSLRSVQMRENEDLKALLAMQGYVFNTRNRGSRYDADIYSALYDLARLKGSTRLGYFKYPEGQVNSIAFIPGKKEFFTSGSDGKILKWDPGSNGQNYQIVYSGNEIIDVLTVSPAADWLGCGGLNSTIRMIPLNGAGQTYELKGHNGKINSLIFSFDGKYLYSAALDGKVLKWDLAARTSIDLATDTMHITSIDISTDNRLIAGVSDQGNALVWNTVQNAERFTIESPGKKIRNLRFRPEKEVIAVGYDDGTIELWDIGLREKIKELKAHQGLINDIRFNGSTSQMATAGTDMTLKLWDADDLVSPPVTFTDNQGIVMAFSFSPDGEVILSGTSGSQPGLVSRPAFADSFAADGCLYVSRNFTSDEWMAYVGRDIAYEETCPGADMRIRIREVR